MRKLLFSSQKGYTIGFYVYIIFTSLVREWLTNMPSLKASDGCTALPAGAGSRELQIDLYLDRLILILGR